MAQQDNNKRATTDDIKTGNTASVEPNADQAGKPGEDRATGAKTAPQNQGHKADIKQTAK